MHFLQMNTTRSRPNTIAESRLSCGNISHCTVWELTEDHSIPQTVTSLT